MLAHARIIFRVGPGLEQTLDKPLAALGTQARIVSLMDAPDIKLLPIRRSEIRMPNDHGPSSHNNEPAGVTRNDGHHHETSAPDAAGKMFLADPHIWLSTRNAEAMAVHIAIILSDINPGNASTYEANLARLRRQLRQLENELKTLTADVATVPYLTYHDAFGYFEAQFGLKPLGFITPHPGETIGARRYGEIRRAVREGGVSCIFTEPQYTPKLAASLARESGVRLGKLDPLGAGISPGPELYFDLLRQTARNMRQCLSAKGR